jgi:hypothetical protein
MVVPNYTYLKMKMSGPKGVIMLGSLIEHTFDYDVECVEHAKAIALDESLVADMEKIWPIRAPTPMPSTWAPSWLPS